MRKTISTIGLLICICVALYLFIPLPSGSVTYSKSVSGVDSSTQTLLNSVRRCPAKTRFYDRKNAYTESGEGLIDPRCAKLQNELGAAVEADDLNFVKKLISDGANAESPNNDYELKYPVAQAVFHKNTEMVAILLDNGADVDHVYSCCMTSKPILYIAVERGDLDTVNLLLDRGARTDYLTGYDVHLSVYDEAANNKPFEIVRLIDNSCGYDVVCRAKFRVKIALNYFYKLL